jgi:hypothetical protein
MLLTGAATGSGYCSFSRRMTESVNMLHSKKQENHAPTFRQENHPVLCEGRSALGAETS